MHKIHDAACSQTYNPATKFTRQLLLKCRYNHCISYYCNLHYKYTKMIAFKSLLSKYYLKIKHEKPIFIRFNVWNWDFSA